MDPSDQPINLEVMDSNLWQMAAPDGAAKRRRNTRYSIAATSSMVSVRKRAHPSSQRPSK
jgi:hypothetical protein